ncbi:Quinol:cytochrome c oxidoreductase iron-sulfur protein [Candidatus Sulfotelmatobacter kueseliae]|uniref:Quinol:cytochrome c oxidoreductase iron-sulfur protein n=1 Tax=Candidatus Sulfotelmatobacter kueseliae TaxID=2042962 RepID=A0A2U3LDL8_9BACT|nr:Quinol:cytochrome c oxidoreductase iron-sulfur protein [Candidatus Sulfotelmatobacter kueseliae]
MTNENHNGGLVQIKKREDLCPGAKDKGKLDLNAVREKIDFATAHDAAAKTGPEYWRSLEELAGSKEFQEALHREFPKGASEWLDSVSRRGFLKVMGASLGLAGMTGCVKLPLEPIIPYVRQPENVVPGRPMYYATAVTLGGYASPVLVESHLGRPTKIEGNDLHPASLGGTDIFTQASILGLYDPDRSQSVMSMGDQRSWQSFLGAIRGPLSAQKALQGAGIRILTTTTTSPTLADQLRNFLKIYPQAKWHVYEPVNRDNVLEGAKLAFGQPVETRYDLSKADVIVSLDADFLSAGFPGNTRYIRDFAARRNPDTGNMNRLYVIESTPSTTGAKADHRTPMRAWEVEPFAEQLIRAVMVVAVMEVPGYPMEDRGPKSVQAIADDLRSHAGASAVIAGDHQPWAVHALAHAINAALGNAGKTVFYTDPVDANPVGQSESLKELVADMNGGKVDLLVILGGNPAYDAPPDLNFADALKNSKIPLRVHHGLYQNETAELCHWHVSQAHELEAWGDARAYDGTVSIIQPLIAPLYNGKSPLEFVALLAGQAAATGYDLVRAYWQKQHSGADFEQFWRKSLHDGWLGGTAFAPKQLTAKEKGPWVSPRPDPNAIELNFRRDPTIYDGQFSNNGWLQELPKPMTKLTWDNAVLIGPKMAERLGIKTEDVVELELGGKKVTGPVWIQAGHPDNSITITLGYGRTRAGRVGTAQGFDAYALRTSDAPWIAQGVKITKTGDTYKLASTQGMQSMDTPDGEHRPLVREATLAEYIKDPNFAKEEEPAPGLTLYTPYPYDKEDYAWGMAIDLNSCVGCNNCMLACQSENNIAVVGKEQTVIGRHMHWIRVDAYYQGDRDNPKAFFQPVPCMQCENAPCEVVCPVGATNHSTEGLNDMVYNRCVGTRYCSNNCPYKVRRFNFLLFQDWETPQYKMMRNPDVSVRSRGVMEKCTYCVQRINERRIDAEREDRKINDPARENELQTACQQSCPAGAIVFGNINDPNSKVSKLKSQARNYSLLGELNTRPRTTYLAEVRNPNPELEG